MEYIFMADNNHRFYEKCLETYNEEKLAFEKTVELCAEYGIERDEKYFNIAKERIKV